MVGALAANLHEGSRSEYLANYVFASFGAAVAVPHHEDLGLDLHCTLMRRSGQRLLSEALYTVQVKSTSEPWTFETGDAVEWFVAHPQPRFLCVVDKATLTLRVFNTCPRFYLWSAPPLPSRLVMTPGSGPVGERPRWAFDHNYCLGAPIIEATLVQLQDDAFHRRIEDALRFWIDVEHDNIERVRQGVHGFMLPDRYLTNRCDEHTGWVTEHAGPSYELDLTKSFKHLGEVLAWVTEKLRQRGDLAGAAKGALLLRHLFPETDWSDRRSALREVYEVQTELNRSLGKDGYVYAGVDALATLVNEAVNPAKVPGPRT